MLKNYAWLGLIRIWNFAISIPSCNFSERRKILAAGDITTLC
jgi:hypothetical protein